MKNPFFKTLFFVFVTAIMLWAQANPLNMTTQQMIKDMGLGINLGNTLESACDWKVNCWITGNTVNAYETAWGSPTITKAMIDGYANSGFKTVRIPVSWSNLMTGDNAGGTYTISPALLNRVEQVVDWVLENNMYAIVNIHWDGGWWERFPTDSAECMRKYVRVWEQVGQRFSNHSGYVVFESLNEEGVWQNVWDRWSGNTNGKARAYGLLNAINQRFTALIRSQSGNNPNRHLLIAGYATDTDLTVDPMFRMPTDSRNRQAVSVHYYDPFSFTHLERDESWAAMRLTWGTTQDINELNTQMNKLKTRFVDQGVPVIVGEYGMAVQGRTAAQVRNYTVAVTRAIYERDMLPVLWAVQLAPSRDSLLYYNRHTRTFPDPPMLTELRAILPSSSSNPPSSSSMAPPSSSSNPPSSSSVTPSSSSAITITCTLPAGLVAGTNVNAAAQRGYL
ncbi:MAG: glycoside hydrolase family 5 protein, partial [Fibromonadaceae bacterium]|nr:glycoside hydrolase family 5 protein [Fibromonadaceae bacterium]